MADMRGIERAFAVLRVVGAFPRSSLTDIAREADLPKPTVLRFLRSLESEGWVVRSDEGGYSLGPSLLGLAGRYLSSDPVLTAASAPMRRMRDELGETTTLSRVAGMARICVQEFPSLQPLRLVLGLGESNPLHAGASGIVLLAHMPIERRRSILAQDLVQMTDRTLTDAESLERECERVREQGWSSSYGQRTAGGVAIAVPITDPSAEWGISALGVYGPEVRCRSISDERRWLDALRECAREIEAAIAS